jgi:hypothetical protein
VGRSTVIQENTVELRSGHPKSVSSSIFSHTQSNVSKTNSRPDSCDCNPSGPFVPLPPQAGQHQALDRATLHNDRILRVGGSKAVMNKLASLYGYASLPFESAPQLLSQSNTAAGQSASHRQRKALISQNDKAGADVMSSTLRQLTPIYSTAHTPLAHDDERDGADARSSLESLEAPLVRFEIDTMHPSDIRLLPMIQEEPSDLFSHLLDTPKSEDRVQDLYESDEYDESTPYNKHPFSSLLPMDYSQSLSPLTPTHVPFI